MTELKKILLTKMGKSKALELNCEEVDLDNLAKMLGENELLIKVHFSGLNFADVMMTKGLYPDAPKLPFTPGYEVCGEVMAIGSNCPHDYKVGQAVIAGTAFGGYTNYLKVSAGFTMPLPENLSYEEGASLLVSGVTAVSALEHLARVRRDDQVLIDCASGSLGLLCIQYLQSIGCSKVIGLTSRKEKFKLLEDRGFEAMTHDQWQVSSKKVDIIINSRGGDTLKRDLNHLNPCGKVVALGASVMVSKGFFSIYKVMYHFLKMNWVSSIKLMNNNQGLMGLNVLNLLGDKKSVAISLELLKSIPFKPRVSKVFLAEDVTMALDFLESGKSDGKVLLKWI